MRNSFFCSTEMWLKMWTKALGMMPRCAPARRPGVSGAHVRGQGAGNDMGSAHHFRRIGEAHHREGLAAAGLAVGEDRAVVALEHLLDERVRRLVVHVALPAVPVVHGVERKGLRVLVRLQRVLDGDLAELGRDLDGLHPLVLLLLRVHRAAAHDHLRAGGVSAQREAGAGRAPGRRLDAA